MRKNCIQDLKDLKGEVFAYVGSINNLKNFKDLALRYKLSTEKPYFLSDHSKGHQGSSCPVQKSRGERLKGGPELAHVKVHQLVPILIRRAPSQLKAHGGIQW